MTLFDIGSDLMALAALMNDCDEELTREASEAIDEWFAELSLGEAVKLDAYVGLIRTFEMEAAAAKAEAEQYTRKAWSRENNVRRLKERIKGYLEASGRTKVTTATNRVIAIQNNGGSIPVEVHPGIDPASIPDEFAIVRRLPNVEAIRDHLAAGGSLPFATLGERGTHLRVR